MSDAVCEACNIKPAKLPFDGRLMCIGCWGSNNTLRNERLLNMGRTISANYVSETCFGCGSRNVDAGDREFWCNDCLMRVRVI
ncbi:hypothetical protein [Streptomyces noursei]